MADMKETETKPTPDPTVLTTEALQREVATLEERDTRLSEVIKREISGVQRELEVRQETRQREHASLEQLVEARLEVLTERLRGIDRASDLLSETVNRAPTEVTKEIDHLRSIMDERFESTATQFKERDTRSERESRDNKVAVDAAFAAQKEAAAKQDEANSKAIDKSESATKEKIDKLTELFRTEISGLTNRHDDLKERIATTNQQVIEISAGKRGGDENQENHRAGSTLVLAIIGTFLVALSLGVGIAALFLGK